MKNMTTKDEHDIEIGAHSCPNCNLCNSNGDFLYQALKERLYEVPGSWNFRKCSNPECGLVWLDPMPFEKEIGKAYRTYFTHTDRENSKNRFEVNKLIMTLLRRSFYILSGALSLRRMRSDLVNMYLPKTTGKLLEVGCGDGFRLARIRNSGWAVEGQEVDPNAAKNASETYGLSVHLGKLEQLALPGNSYDAIVMVHVIEHIYDPLLFLKECYRLLKPSGCLVCVTPNIESYGHNHFKSSWLHLDPPRHIWLFSLKSMGMLLKRLPFKQKDIFTTPANAEQTYSGSMSIKYTGRHQFNEQFKWDTAIREILFQRRALASHKKDNRSGEEIIVILRK